MKKNRPTAAKSPKRPLKIADSAGKEDEQDFADPKELLNTDNDPASRVEDRLREISSPPPDRSATSL
jgi:hypothetical protein